MNYCRIEPLLAVDHVEPSALLAIKGPIESRLAIFGVVFLTRLSIVEPRALFVLIFLAHSYSEVGEVLGLPTK